MAALPTDEPGTMSLMLAALAFCGGYMDAVSYLGLGRVFTANMTGNTVLLGIAIAGLHTARVVGSLVALIGYCAGVAIGTVILSSGTPLAVEPSRAWRAIGSETALVLLIMLLWIAVAEPGRSASILLLFVALSAFGMGMQTEAARCMSVGGVSTTFVTGTLSDLSAIAVGRVLGATVWPALRRPDRGRAGLNWPVLLAIWVAYLTGGTVGAFAVTRWSGRALFAPLAILGLTTLVAYVERRHCRPGPLARGSQAETGPVTIE